LPEKFTAESAEAAEVKYSNCKLDELVKSPKKRHPGESRGPEPVEITGFRLSPE
jgi:hypothetical protein